MANKFYLLLCVVLIMPSSIYAEDTISEPYEIIRCYRESLQRIQTVSMKIDTDVLDTVESESGKKFNHVNTSFTFRRDNDRTEWVGDRLFLGQDGVVDISKSFVLNNVMMGESSWEAFGHVNDLPIMAIKSEKYTSIPINLAF